MPFRSRVTLERLFAQTFLHETVLRGSLTIDLEAFRGDVTFLLYWHDLFKRTY